MNKKISKFWTKCIAWTRPNNVVIEVILMTIWIYWVIDGVKQERWFLVLSSAYLTVKSLFKLIKLVRNAKGKVEY